MPPNFHGFDFAAHHLQLCCDLKDNAAKSIRQSPWGTATRRCRETKKEEGRVKGKG